jgi:prepilin-type N-terminal cleavage/methylation domain-containing protein
MKQLRIFHVLKNQKGFTLLETLLALLISAFVGAAIISTTISIGNVNDRNIARTIAVKQVESAVHFINRDTQQAQKIERNGLDYWLKLSWTSWDDNNTQNVVKYYFVNNNLTRSVSLDGGAPQISPIAHDIVTKSITPPSPFTVPPEKSWTIQLTAEVRSGSRIASETREIKIVPRPGS